MKGFIHTHNAADTLYSYSDLHILFIWRTDYNT